MKACSGFLMVFVAWGRVLNRGAKVRGVRRHVSRRGEHARVPWATSRGEHIDREPSPKERVVHREMGTQARDGWVTQGQSAVSL